MNYKLTKLKNGLRVITVPLSNMESVTVTVWVKVGSRYESAKISGLSHFLEHMVFKGSRKRPSAKEIATAIDSFGGEFNASTGKEWTNFYIKARSAKLNTAIDVLSDMVLNPLIQKDDVEREKGVILEEMAMYEDTPIAKIEDYFENLIFSGNSLEHDIVGNRDSVKSIQRNDFLRYRNIHYGSNNVVVTVSGGVTHDKALSLVKKHFSDLKKKKPGAYKNFSSKQKSPKVALHTKKIEQAHLILGFLGYKRKHKNRFAEAVLSSILGGGMSSRMFTEVREKRGLAYAVKTSADHLVDCGYFSTYAGVDVRRVDEAIKVILKEYYKMTDKTHEIDRKEMTKAKEYIKGHIALALEDTKDINHFFGIRELLDNEIETPEDIFKGIDEVELDEVLSVAKEIFKNHTLNLTIIGPYKDQKRFEKLVN